MSKKSVKKQVELPFTSPEFSQVWELYLKHRREKGSSNYTETGLCAAFKKLLRLSNNTEAIAIKILEQSLENNWTGTFALKLETNGRTNTYFQNIGSGRIDGSTVETPF